MDKTRNIILITILLLALAWVGGALWSAQQNQTNDTAGTPTAKPPAETSTPSDVIETAPESDFEAVFNAGYYGMVITKYIGSSDAVRMPARINGEPVKVIGDKAFFDKYDIKAVIFPEGVMAIGSEAFAGCYRLRDVTIPDSVTSIGDGAFFGTITDVTYKGVTYTFDTMDELYNVVNGN